MPSATLADVALAHAMTGDFERAAKHVETILSIDRSWTNAAIFPPFSPWIAARILHAKDDERTAATLAWAVTLTREFSASIDVPELAASFLGTAVRRRDTVRGSRRRVAGVRIGTRPATARTPHGGLIRSRLQIRRHQGGNVA